MIYYLLQSDVKFRSIHVDGDMNRAWEWSHFCTQTRASNNLINRITSLHNALRPILL